MCFFVPKSVSASFKTTSAKVPLNLNYFSNPTQSLVGILGGGDDNSYKTLNDFSNILHNLCI